MPRSSHLLVAVLCGLSMPCSTQAQGANVPAPADATGLAHLQAAPQTIVSMGQPSRWHPYGIVSGGGFYADENTGAGGTLTLGAFHDWIVPVGQGLGPAVELWGRAGGAKDDYGGRLYLASPAMMWRAGIDQSFGEGGAPAFAFGIDLPLQRSGTFLNGGQLRIDWIPARAQWNLGLQVPLGSRWIGHTRPKDIDANLPKPRDLGPPPVISPEVAHTLQLVYTSAHWLSAMTCGFLWDDKPEIKQTDLQDLRDFVTDIRSRIAKPDSLRPNGHSYAQEIILYHELVDRLFGLSIGASGSEAITLGRPVADAAREALLEQVLLPYDRAFGRVKDPDDLTGLAQRAEVQFSDWLLQHPEIGPAAIARAQSTFRAWLDQLERVRAGLRDQSGIDPDLVWLPLQWGLRPEQFDSQAELDAVLERAVGQPFSRGNTAVLINALQFTSELQRQVDRAEDYHVLWIHDYRGRDGVGDPDLVGYYQTLRYLETLTKRVREYDRTGRLPAYFVFLDQNYYDANDSKLWLDVLERPLDHQLKLDEPYEGWADTVGYLQDSLRAAVAGSSRLMAEAGRSGGKDWLKKIVKVHVSVTNPADLTFRSDRMLTGLPGVPDAAARDHRKVAFYDITESDPGRGAVMVTGTGVGEHYASPTWEDRALRVRGPAALQMKTAARRLLLSQGFRMDEVPAPLRETAPPIDYDARVRELEANGWTASVMNQHNETGFGSKDATVACMILYTLVPPGTELWIPDSVWTSTTIAAALMGAALRGCSVLVIAPSLENAPSAGFPQMSRSRVILGILVEVANGLKQNIDAAGGRLRVGLYTRETPQDDIAGRLREFARAHDEDPMMKELFPFPETAIRNLDSLAARVEREGGRGGGFASDVSARLPKMHRKTQFFGSSEALRALARDPETIVLFRRMVDRIVAMHRRGDWEISTDEEAANVLAEVSRIDARLPADVRERRIYYMTVGSVNKDSRSSFLDGETQFVVSGVWGLATYFDFYMVLSDTKWLGSYEDLERYIPQYTGFQHRMGRFLRRIL